MTFLPKLQIDPLAYTPAQIVSLVQLVITQTVADLASETVKNFVGVGLTCNDADKNLYKYLYHR